MSQLESNKNQFNTPFGQNQEDDFDLNELLSIIRKRLIWVLLLIGVGYLASKMYLRYTKPVYYSESVLKLEVKNETGALGMQMTGDPSMSNYNDLSGEIEFIKSNLIYDDVIERLGLGVSYFMAGKILDEEKYKNSPFKITYGSQENIIQDRKIWVRLNSRTEISYGLESADGSVEYQKGRYADTLNIEGFKFRLALTDDFSEDLLNLDLYFKLNSYGTLKNYFSQNLTVQVFNLNAKTIKIGCNDYTPAKAADIVNAVDTIYLYKTIQNKQQVQEQTIHFINSQLDSTEKKLNLAESNIESFVRAVKTNDPSSEVAITLAKMDQIRESVKMIDRQIYYSSDVQSQIDSEKPIANLLAVFEGLDNSQLKTGVLQLNEKFKDLEQLKMSYGSNTLAYKKLQNETITLKTGVIEIIRQEQEVLKKDKVKLARELAQLQTKFYSLPAKETELNRLRRFYDLYEKFYLMLQEKRVQYGISKAGTVPEFVILSKAFPNYTPVSPVRLQVMAIGVVSGVLLGLLIIAASYFAQNTIVSEKKLKSNLQVPLLGSVPKYTKVDLKYSRLVVNDNPKSAISESFRSLRTNVEFMCNEQSHRVFSVTSTTSGEGKTFVAVNLAGVFAVTGKRVVVLDMDMRKPKVHLGFDAENLHGMSSILSGKATLAECVQKTGHENLDFISAGSIPPNPTELMLNPSFDQLLDDLKQQYDLVLIDTPPVGLVTDGNIIMKKTDLSLFVMRFGYTPKGSESLVNDLYASGQFKRMGVILNSIDNRPGYGYGYGYYEDDPVEKNLWKSIFKRK